MLSAKYGMRKSPCRRSSAGRKSFGIMWRRCARSRRVPSFHVYMMNRIANVSSIVNQPPCRNFAIDAMKNISWMARNTMVNTTASTRLRSYHMYTASRIVVVIIVMVSAKP